MQMIEFINTLLLFKRTTKSNTVVGCFGNLLHVNGINKIQILKLGRSVKYN